jgi:hypothetical protein
MDRARKIYASANSTQMNETLEYIKTFARFPFALQKFLQHRLTVDQAKQIVHERMEQREENFLRIVETSVYGYPRSPYLPLLKMAGCELGDLRALVQHHGLENTLRQLRAAGVYITFEEFKGRKPIIRNGTTIPVQPTDWNNPFIQRAYSTESGGSTGTVTTVAQDLNHLAARAPHNLLTHAAWQVQSAPCVVWRGILPDSTLSLLLESAYTNAMPKKWFSHLALSDSKSWLKYGLATYYIVGWMRLYGTSVPFPEYALPENAVTIAHQIDQLLATHQQCFLRSSVSRALRVCLEAEKIGIQLQGLTIRAGGEPTTPAKVRAIERSGARFIANYALTEAGTLANGCVHPTDYGDVHLFKDAFALITHPHTLQDMEITVPAFNLTTLLPTAPKILLNLQMDDYGIVEERQCGCELGDYGYTTHLREIRSYSKLVGEGVTLVGNEMLDVLEQVLPSRFGGSPLDYQLMEEEDAQGLTRLYLIIHPNVPLSDESAVIQVVLQALRNSSPMGDSARSVWQHTHSLEIKRMVPILTGRGKLLPLHLTRNLKTK